MECSKRFLYLLSCCCNERNKTLENVLLWETNHLQSGKCDCFITWKHCWLLSFRVLLILQFSCKILTSTLTRPLLKMLHIMKMLFFFKHFNVVFGFVHQIFRLSLLQVSIEKAQKCWFSLFNVRVTLDILAYYSVHRHSNRPHHMRVTESILQFYAYVYIFRYVNTHTIIPVRKDPYTCCNCIQAYTIFTFI